MENDGLKAERITRRSVLIEAGLYIADPEAIEGLVFPITDSRHYGRLLREYDTKDTTGRKVRCAACPVHQRHNKGFVVELDDGSRALIGIDCGEKHFGKGTWAEMRANLRHAQDRAYNEARVGPALAKISHILPILRDLRVTLGCWSEFRGALHREQPDLYEDLIEAASEHGGSMVLDQLVWVNRVDAAGQHTRYQETQAQQYGRIPFPEGFLTALPDARIVNAISILRDAYRTLTDPQKQDLSSRANTFAKLRNAKREVEDAKTEHEGWKRNLRLEWWEDACRWRNDSGDWGKYRLKGRRLSRSNQGDPWRIDIPTPNAVETDLFENVLSAWPD